MTATSTNYYGYDKKTYDDCYSLIAETNARHVEILNLWFIIINIFCIIMSFLGLFSMSQREMEFYVVYAALAIGFFIVSLIFRKLKISVLIELRLLMYILLWMSYGIQMSIGQPYMAATMFVVLLVVISFSFIMTMIKMMAIMTLSVGIFILSSYGYKPAAIAEQDTYNAIIFTSLALILHFAFQRTRMKQFATFQKNVQIQRELEIKSSFDALTSLLNRGRFFSLAGNILSSPHDEYMVLCLLDLDEFKQINDRLGHQMGDKAIQIAGTTIIETMNIDMSEKWEFQERVMKEGGSFPGRLGGDEFIVLIRGLKSSDDVVTLLNAMLTSLNSVEMGELHGIHASFGVTEIIEGDDIDAAYKRADEALYESKRAGKNQIRFNNVK